MDVVSFSQSCGFKMSRSDDWDRWSWHLSNAVKSIAKLNAALAGFTHYRIQPSELLDQISREAFSIKVTPHMLYALHRGLEAETRGTWEAFCAAFVPTALEAARSEWQANGIDGIGEELPDANPVHSVTNFYGNRVLFRVTKMCAAHCRYCFRRRMVSDADGWDEHSIRAGLDYISANPEIHEVILSGGDPLVLGDSRIAFICDSLRRVTHVRRIRIDTKIITMLPQRVTDALLQVFRENRRIYVVCHFSHTYELDPTVREACARLVNAGVPVLSHTPLLRGVNDSEEQLINLMDDLVDCRVRPYYLIQFIPTKWTQHFRVPISRGLTLMEAIHKRCGGLAWPTYVVYLPKAGGKVPVTPRYLLDRVKNGYLFRSLDGREIVYEEPEQDDAPPEDA